MLLTLFLLLICAESVPFVTKWNTSLFFLEGHAEINGEMGDFDSESTRPYGTSPHNQIRLGTKWGGVYDFIVDWGDGGSTDHITEWDQPETLHTYDEEGVYEITMEGHIEAWGFDTLDTSYDGIKLIEISQWGDLKLQSGGKWFEGCYHLDITATDSPDLASVTDYKYGFQYSGIKNVDFTAWDTSGATR